MSRSYTHVLTIYVTEAQHAEVARRAESRRVAMSDIVREAIDAQFSPHKGGRNFTGLTPEQVERMRTRRAAGESYRSIAADFGVSPATVWLRTKDSPAEAARDAACDGRDSPPSAPVASESRVASAGEGKAHPWRRGRAVSARRVPGGRAE